MTASLSPDCKVGKHRACSGDAWDHEADGPVACPCECHRPKRVQMSRQHPWRAENPDAVIVARPSKWGNPFIVGTPENGGNITREVAVAEFRRALMEGRLQFGLGQVRANLRGKDLACWCKLSDPCHADILLELANGGTP